MVRCNHHYPGWRGGEMAAKVDLEWSNCCHLRQLVLIVVAPIWCLMHPSAAASYLFTYAYKRQKVTTYISLELYLLFPRNSILYFLESLLKCFCPCMVLQLVIAVQTRCLLYKTSSNHSCFGQHKSLVKKSWNTDSVGALNSGDTHFNSYWRLMY